MGHKSHSIQRSKKYLFFIFSVFLLFIGNVSLYLVMMSASNETFYESTFVNMVIIELTAGFIALFYLVFEDKEDVKDSISDLRNELLEHDGHLKNRFAEQIANLVWKQAREVGFDPLTLRLRPILENEAQLYIQYEQLHVHDFTRYLFYFNELYVTSYAVVHSWSHGDEFLFDDGTIYDDPEAAYTNAGYKLLREYPKDQLCIEYAATGESIKVCFGPEWFRVEMEVGLKESLVALALTIALLGSKDLDGVDDFIIEIIERVTVWPTELKLKEADLELKKLQIAEFRRKAQETKTKARKCLLNAVNELQQVECDCENFRKVEWTSNVDKGWYSIEIHHDHGVAQNITE